MSKLKINMVSESEISVRGHGVHTAYIEMTRALAKRPDCTVVVNEFFKETDADIVHIHTIGLHSFSKLLFSKGVKVVSAHIVPDSLIGSFALAKLWKPLARLYMKAFYTRADKVLAVSKTVAEKLKDELGVSEDKIVVLYNSINTDSYKPTKLKKEKARKDLKIKSDEFVVVGNGQIQPRKRFDTFVEVAKKNPNIRFFWVGGIPFKFIGADYVAMQHLIDHVPNNMTVTGVIELEEVKKYLWSANVFMLPAEQENHPMAVIEAAAAGLPIVLRDIPEYKDTFNSDAMLCRTNQQFSDAITRLHEDKKLSDSYVAKSKNIAIRYDSVLSAKKLIEIYKDQLAKRSVRRTQEAPHK